MEEVRLINKTIEVLAERSCINVDDVTDEMVRLELVKMVINSNANPSSITAIIKELHGALTDLLKTVDDEGWVNEYTGEDRDVQRNARKALANVPREYYC